MTFSEKSLRAALAIQAERGEIYNDGQAPERSFKAIAELTSALTGSEIHETTVTAMFVALKLVRFQTALRNGILHLDSLEDFVSYAALHAEALYELAQHQLLTVTTPAEEPPSLLTQAAEAMSFLAEQREAIIAAVPEGTTAELKAYSEAVKSLNEAGKAQQQAVFGMTIDELMETGNVDQPNASSISSD